ncbi:MAG TPA: hypothetical protein GXX75_16860 [Clostridiales bacterium]|nr:hypothetical protein [Clostridiales bacterium]
MKIEKKYEPYFEVQEAGKRFTLADEKTKLYLQANGNAIWKVKVDKGIIADVTAGINKCDFIIYDEIKEETHLIELKGAIIDKALIQLEETLKNLEEEQELVFLIKGQKIVNAFIVSPGRQEIPRGINTKSRFLAQRLSKHSKIKAENLFDFIKYVKVVMKSNAKGDDGNHILCSPSVPIIF